MSALKVGVAGCGRIARQVHLNVLTRLAGVEVAALAEPDPGRLGDARRLAPGARAYHDFRDLAASDGVDAVVICLPNSLHAEAAVAALGAGKHVYLEKPLATSPGEASRVIAAWRDARVVGMVGFNYRFNPLYRAVRRALGQGRAGELVGVRSAFTTPARELPGWKRRRQDGGGVLLDLASHHIDLVHFLLGRPVTEVGAQVWSRQSEADGAALEMRLADGLVIQSFFSLGAVDEDRFEFYGRAGKLSVDRYSSLRVEMTGAGPRFARLRRLGRGLRSLASLPYALEKMRAPGNEPSYGLALRHFVEAARAGRPASPDLADGLRSLGVIAAAEESAVTGRFVRVEVPDTPGPRTGATRAEGALP